jgi:DNA repair protein RadC
VKTIKQIELRIRREKLAEPRTPYNALINVPGDVCAVAQSLLDGVDQERFLAFPLDTKNSILGYVEVAKGGVDLCPVDIREVFRAAIVMGSSSIIVVHNHPSGDPTPSAEDLKLTERLVQAGKILGMPVLDHIIVAEDDHASLAAMGLLNKSEE